MWNRACPLCFVRVPRSLVLTRGEDLNCPSCHTPLEISRVSRVFAAFLGLIAAYVGAEFFGLSTTGGWVLPMLGALLGYGIGSTLVLYFVSDLVVQPLPTRGHFPQSHK
jgi:hypothetical protein